jgi:PhnB protein
MTASQPGAVRPVPERLHTVTPRLVVADGGAAIVFYAQAFGAEEVGERFTGPGGEVIHAEIRIGDSVVMITEDSVDGPVSSPGRLGGMVTCVMALYWEDVDAAWQRAVAAGAEVIYPLEDQFYGERGGRLRDPFGQQWMMSQHTEDVQAQEIARRAAAVFRPEGRPRLEEGHLPLRLMPLMSASTRRYGGCGSFCDPRFPACILGRSGVVTRLQCGSGGRFASRNSGGR